jgi:L-seryl-tRNA(Ser) seleniumtransferase
MVDSLRALPPVDALAAQVEAPRAVAVAAARAVLAERRAELLEGRAGGEDLAARAREWAAAAELPSLRRVLNATGVIVHTNLGRAPLAEAARAAVARACVGYSNLEWSVASGARGSRHDHVSRLLCELTGAEAAIAVNNCAGATLLAAAALAGRGREVIVSRGQLVEIGGGFRVPDVIAQAGARLVEVGTTNRTRRADYERAIGPDTAAILRAHPSNFRQLGFVQEVEIEELCELGVPVIDDVGSGVLADDLPLLRDEPPVRRSVAAGAALVCFSGDKLLGGPQAGLIAGRAAAVAAARAHPLARALRLDKLGLAALEATLRLYRDPERARREIPVLAMLEASAETLRDRAARLAAAITRDRGATPPVRAAEPRDRGATPPVGAALTAVVIAATARVGGGALPLLELPGPVVAVEVDGVGPDELAARLRAADPPVVGRIERGRLLLDPRTLADDEIDDVAAAVRAAVTRS